MSDSRVLVPVLVAVLLAGCISEQALSRPAPIAPKKPGLPLGAAPPASPPTSSFATPTDLPTTAFARTDDVTLTEGDVRGELQGVTYAYKGIPYAAPPVGALRWRAPQPPKRWPGVRDGRRFGAPCPQLDAASRQPLGQEDCLTLNVWAPAGPRRALPVLVFLHGGGNLTGSGDQRLNGEYAYDGAWLAEHGPAVVVTLNYRLGALGFLAHPAFAAESEHHAAGNYGLQDQIAALRWLQRNARAFGGDPARVMLFGQASGARNVCMHLVSPHARGLFSRAMVLSGNCEALPREDAALRAEQFAQTVGCGDMKSAPECLRTKDVTSLVTTPIPASASESAADLLPTIDGLVIPDMPLGMLSAGRFNHVPVIFSTTADEFAPSRPPVAQPPPTVDARAERRKLFKPAVAEEGTGGSPRDDSTEEVAVITDSTFTCPTGEALRALAPHQPGQAWRALYRHTFDADKAGTLGAAHGFDLIGFHHPKALIPPRAGAVLGADFALTPREEQFADAMGNLWLRFAATGNPNGSGIPRWPTYEEKKEPYLALDLEPTLGEGWQRARCDAWRTGH